MELSNFGIQDINSISSYTLKTTRDKDELVIKLKDKRFGFLNKQNYVLTHYKIKSNLYVGNMITGKLHIKN